MNFAVVWLPEALGQLADVWTNATDRNAVATASHRIDRRLATDPNGEGESRELDRRIIFDPPLQVLYRAPGPDGIVYVIGAGVFGRRA